MQTHACTYRWSSHSSQYLPAPLSTLALENTQTQGLLPVQAFLTQDIDWGGHPGRVSQSISPVLETRLSADRFHLAQAFLTQDINWGGHPGRASRLIPPVLRIADASLSPPHQCAGIPHSGH